jgi:hypothetical protein
MCLMCVEFARDRMNFLEVRRALGEMVNTTTDAAERRHYEELAKMSEEELQKAAASYAEEQDI